MTPRAERTPHTPPSPTSGLAVSLRREGARVLVAGAYRVPLQQALSLGEAPLLGALVLVATANGRAHAFRPWDQAVAFADDEERGPSTVEAAFEVDLTERFPLDPGDTVYVLACLGPERSKTVSLTV